jgi:hypothetical protein
LQRTKEWNEALEKYCDDSDLTGVERLETYCQPLGTLCKSVLQQLGDRAKGIPKLLLMQNGCILFSRLPKEGLDGAAH